MSRCTAAHPTLDNAAPIFCTPLESLEIFPNWAHTLASIPAAMNISAAQAAVDKRVEQNSQRTPPWTFVTCTHSKLADNLQNYRVARIYGLGRSIYTPLFEIKCAAIYGRNMGFPQKVTSLTHNTCVCMTSLTRIC